RFLEDHGVDDVQLIATGGFRTPDEMAKALALGPDAVALATASLLAIGCQQYRACHRGTCPVGIATQESERRMRLDPEISAQPLLTFLTAATVMITDSAGSRGSTASPTWPAPTSPPCGPTWPAAPTWSTCSDDRHTAPR